MSRHPRRAAGRCRRPRRAADHPCWSTRRPGRWACSGSARRRRRTRGAHHRADPRRSGPAHGVTREVELDLPAARRHGDPLGVHVRAVALDGGRVAIEATDVTEAHRVARVRRDFVANVSHELKTPVGALQLLAEALLDATDKDPAAGHPLRRADQARVGPARPARLRAAGAVPAAGRRAAARAGAGRRRPDHRRGLDRTKTPGAAKHIEVAVHGPHGLPSTATRTSSSPPWSTWSRTRSPTRPSRPPGRITTSSRHGDDAGYIEIAVSDQGIGIEPATSTGSSSGSTGPTGHAPGPPAAPALAWRSSSTSPPITAAGSTWPAASELARRSPCGCPRVRQMPRGVPPSVSGHPRS